MGTHKGEDIKVQQCGIFRKIMFDLPTREQGKRQEVTRSEVRELRNSR